MAKKQTKPEPGAQAAKGKKPRQYGEPIQATDAPGEGWQKSAGGRHLTFTKFGDSIQGEFVKLEQKTGKGKSDILHFIDATGAHVTAFSSWQISRDIENNNIQPGDQIKIVFVNVAKGKGGRTCKLFDFYFRPKSSGGAAPVAKKKGKR